MISALERGDKKTGCKMEIENLFQAEAASRLVSEEVVNADGSRSLGECRIVVEHSVNVFLNEKLILKLACTPSDLAELVIGRLISEGYVETTDEIDMIYICSSGKRIRVFLKEGMALNLKRAVEEVPTCCTDNRVFLRNENAKNIEPRDGEGDTRERLPVQKLQKAEWRSEWIFALANEFLSDSKIHKTTHGTHSCYLSVQGEILFTGEDIGRHNAMDKVIGYAAMQGLKREACILYTSGRVSTDMVRKAIMARIPVLVSKAVPTDAAVELARAYGLTLICKAWPDRYEVFH